MKAITSIPRLAALGLVLGALAASIPVFTGTQSAIGFPGRPISSGPLGTIESDGTLDSSFDAGNFTNGQVLAAVLQTDGKLLIGGQFSKVHGATRNGIARLNTDGTLDLSFDPGVGSDFGVGNISVQTDGKIILSEFLQSFDGVNRQAGLARLNANGSLDAGFNPGRVISIDGSDDGNGNAISPGTVNSVVLQADGKFVVVGTFFFIITGPGTNVPRSCVARFNSDGTFDPSYDPGAGAVHSVGTFNTFVWQAVSQNVGENAGKIILRGLFDSFDSNPVNGLARMNTDGSFDSTFDAGTAADRSILGLFVQSDDKILAFGTFDSFNGVPCTNIVRLETSGAVDPGFSTPAFPTSEYNDEGWVAAVAQQSDGKLIVGGYFHLVGGATANNVVRLETSGARDASFSATGTGPSSWNVSAVVVHPSDGKIFFGGYFSTFGGEYRANAAWANPDGSVDNSFAGLAGVSDYNPNIWVLATQPDGKILMTGLFTSFNGTSHYNILRLNPDATIDSSFNAETDRSTRALLLQPDGKILIAGAFDEVNGVPMGRIARLNSDGTLDSSFDPGTGADSYYVRALALDSAGNIYVGGEFYTFNGIPRLGLAKLSPTGALDLTFNPDGGGVEPVFIYAITPPDDAGNIVIGGSFNTYNGVTARRMARVSTTTGALDETFGADFTGGTVYALRVAPDGKYYAGGSFSAYNGVTTKRIARINTNGTLDLKFSGPDLSGVVYALALQNGKVYLGGQTITSPSGQIMRLTDSGELDSTFVTGTGFDISPVHTYGPFQTKISALAIQADGKLLVGGIFTHYNGTARSCLARLTGPLPPITALGNISTRLKVETSDNVMIGGFIVTGSTPKKVIVRAIGPSLPLAGNLSNPTLELRDSSGALIRTNDNWRSDQEKEIIASGIPPSNDLESAIVETLPANGSAYTAIVRGLDNGTGIGLVEAYDLDQKFGSTLANISTRGFVQTGENVLIGGLIVLGQNPLRVIVRAIGPSSSLPGALGDPVLELHDGNGALITSNDSWRSDQEAEIIATGIPPANDLESAIVRDLAPGNYTAVVRGANDTTGVALVEIYALD